MAEGAHVSSIEALEAFRASLIVYRSKARPTVEEIGAEVLRTRLWLENDQRIYWESQVRRRSQILEEAKKDLFSAQLANLRETTSAEVMAVRRAERALEEAQNKLGIVKRWAREFGSRVEPLAKQLERIQGVLSSDLPKAEHYLAQAIKTLDAYTAAPVPSLTDQPPAGTAAQTPSEPENKP